MYLEKLQTGTWSVIFLLQGHLLICQMYHFQKSTSITNLQWRIGQLLCGVNTQKHDIALLDSWTRCLGCTAELVFFFLVPYVNVLDAWQSGNLTLLINPIPQISHGQIQSSVPPSR